MAGHGGKVMGTGDSHSRGSYETKASANERGFWASLGGFFDARACTKDVH